MDFDSSRLHRICALLAGTTSVFARDIDARALSALCERARVTSIHVGTYKLASLVKGSAARRLPGFTHVLTGGSRVPGGLRQAVKATLTGNLWVSYATSEVGTISLASPDQHDAFPEGVGLPEESVTIEIVDSEGGPVADGDIGRVRVRKSGQASSYLGEPPGAKFENGWFYPNDLLSRRGDGPLIFHGRVDDVMILNGINIFPSAIEDVLEGHPAVSEAAAFAIKSRVHGDIPAAAIVVSDKSEVRDPSYFLDYCREALGVRGPRQILIVDSIPRNAAGKVLRQELA